MDPAGRALTVVGGVGPSGRGLAGRAVLLDARVRGDGREDGDGRVVSVGVPGGAKGERRVQLYARAWVDQRRQSRPEPTRTSDRCACFLDGEDDRQSTELLSEKRGGELTEFDPDATLSESEVLLNAHVALQHGRESSAAGLQLKESLDSQHDWLRR